MVPTLTVTVKHTGAQTKQKQPACLYQVVRLLEPFFLILMFHLQN